MAFEAQLPRDISDYGSPQDHGARCDICPLAGNPFVPFEASKGKLKLVLVGEGPGRREEVLRRPFVGMTGERLTEELTDAGLDRDNAYISNAAMCASDNDKENERAAECCAPRLLKELSSLPADVPIVPLGKAAARTILGVNSILLSRGFVWHGRDMTESIGTAEAKVRKLEKDGKDATDALLKVDMLKERHKLAGRAILPTLHPTFAFIHNETWAPIFHVDMDRVARWVKGVLTADMLIDRIERVSSLKELKRRKRVFITTDNPDEIRAAMAILGNEIACDIETERLKPLTPLLARVLTVQISDGDRSIVIAPWKTEMHAAVLTQCLRGRKVWFHNGYCLHGDSLVVMADGTRRKISQIVNGRERPFVMAMNAGGEIVPAKVTGWSKTRQVDQRWVRIEVAGGGYGITATPDHKIYTGRGWVEADHIRYSDRIAQSTPAFSFEMQQALLGTLLGDSSMRVEGYKARVTGVHVKRSGLAQHKAAVMPHIHLGRPYEPRGAFKDAGTVQPYKSHASREILALRSLIYDKAGQKRLRVATVKLLGPIGLAWWFMDDGCLQKREPEDRISIATNCFTFKEVSAVAAWFTERFGRTWACKSSNVLALSATAAKAFCAYIAPHVPPVMRYKFPRGSRWPAYVDSRLIETHTPQFAQVIAIDRNYRAPCWPKVKALGETRYCLTVKDHHNFFTANGLVHNCFDQIALREQCGVDFTEVEIEDTLTGHHAFASQYPQKLDHVVATFCDSGPWKIRFGVRGAEEKGLAPVHSDDNELEVYGATDAVVTKHAAVNMKADLERERSVYEFDKRRSVLYASMQVVGYHVDKRRRAFLHKLLKRRAAGLVGRMRRIAKKPYFEPMKLHQVRHVLFKTLRAPMLNPTPTGLAGTSNATLESLRTGDVPGEDKTKTTRVARFCEALLAYRVTTKVNGTYIVPVRVHKDGRAHFNSKPFGVLTGRPAGRQLSYPRWSREPVERAREIFTAAPGCCLVYFDLAQAEGRFAANLSNDAGLIEACAVDLHTRNALILFGHDERVKERLTRDPKGKHCPRHSEKGSAAAACNCGKPWRDITKNVGFAILYQAGIKKVFAFLRSQGFPVGLDVVEGMFAAMRDAYPDYDRYVQENMAFVRENGYLRSALVGRIVWFGFHPEPAKIANIPVQGGIADVMDLRLLDEMHPRLRGTGARQILHHYDSATFEVPKKGIEWVPDKKGKPQPKGKVIEVIEEVWAQPVKLKKSIVCRADREFLLPAEIKVGQRWSDF